MLDGFTQQQRQGYSQKIRLKIARSTLTLMHLLKYYWDNQPECYLAQPVAVCEQQTNNAKKKKTVLFLFFFKCLVLSWF